MVIKTSNDNPPKAFISKGFQKFENRKIPTFMDSGASDTMFILRNVFTEYKLVVTHVGDSAKAENGNFKIIREGSVTQQYQVEGKKWRITYTHALYMPTLNANLASMSTLDNAGLTITFRGGKGVVRKDDGTIILASQNINRMYLLETLDNPPEVPLAMSSLSQLTSLKQWH